MRNVILTCKYRAFSAADSRGFRELRNGMNEATFTREALLNFETLDTQASPSTSYEMHRAFLGEEEIVISVTLLEFMMPSVKVNMEYHDGAVRQTS